MIVFHNDVVNVILNTWSFLLEKETNIWKPQLEPRCIHLYILLLFSLSLVFFPIPHKHFDKMFTQAKHFLAIIAQCRSQGLPCLCQPGWAELTDWQEEGGESPVQFGLLLTYKTKSAWLAHEASQELPGIQAAHREGSFPRWLSAY